MEFCRPERSIACVRRCGPAWCPNTNTCMTCLSCAQQHAAQQRMFAALDLQKQVFYARLDQELHAGASGAMEGSAATSDLVAQLMAETLSFPPVPGISPQVCSLSVSCIACLHVDSLQATCIIERRCSRSGRINATAAL